MGGPVPLGYEVIDRKLVVKQDEAEQVRHIMQRYLALRSVPALAEELNSDGYRTKIQNRASGPHRGGCAYRRGTLYHMLSNRIYRGFIVHKGKAYPGEHQAIVDEALWDAVQAMLAENASGSSRRLKHQQPSLLTGKVADGEGRAMSPSHACRNQRRYRYYVTRPDQLDGTRAWRVSAHDLEQLVCSRLAEKLADQSFVLGLGGDETTEAEALQQVMVEADMMAAILRSSSAHAKAELLGALVREVRLHEDSVELAIGVEGARERLGLGHDASLNSEPEIITIDAVRVRRGHQLRLIVPGAQAPHKRPAHRDEKLIALMAEAHQARQLVLSNPQHSLARIASDHSRCRTRLGRLAALSCLAPDIVTAIVEGRQPEHLTASRLATIPLPLSWPAQRRALGFA